MSNIQDPKAKFREALAKKKVVNLPDSRSSRVTSKVRGEQLVGRTPKVFRRKSGSS